MSPQVDEFVPILGYLNSRTEPNVARYPFERILERSPSM